MKPKDNFWAWVAKSYGEDIEMLIIVGSKSNLKKVDYYNLTKHGL